jgi:8-oxo-dGTP pyrophosphatase MutT (NUDIX family)
LTSAPLDRLAARLQREPGATVEHADADRRWAAVSAILRVDVVRGLELLVIRRPEKLGDPWSGHMALPGGRRDARDRDLMDTAVRETHEEVGIDLRAHGALLGTLDDLAPRNPALPPIVVRPFVARLDADVPVIPNDEVAAHYWVPIDALRAPSAQAEHVVRIASGPGGHVPTAFARDMTSTDGLRARFPAFQFDGQVIWGLTERVVRQLLQRLE